MSYIIKCKGFHCPIKENCLRFTTPDHTPYQEYFNRIPFTGGSCRFFAEQAKPAEIDRVEVIFEPTNTVTFKPKRPDKPKVQRTRKPVKR
jgi:hypothetical protein